MPVHLTSSKNGASGAVMGCQVAVLSIPEYALLRVVVNKETIPPILIRASI